MASLISLPNELKDLVFQHLCCADFVRLARTCRELHAIALPIAYQDLAVTWNNRVGGEGGGEGEGVGGGREDSAYLDLAVTRTPQLHSLLRTMVQRPEYADCVKTLRLEAVKCSRFGTHGHGDFCVDIPSSDVKVNEADEVMLRRALENMGLSEDESWTKAIETKQQFFIVMAMVVAHCSKLERLDLSILFLLQNDWFEDMIQNGLIGENGLCRWMADLKHLRLTCDTSGFEWTPGCLDFKDTALYPFFLRNLEILEFERFETYHVELDEIWIWPTIPRASLVTTNLTTLRLLRSSAQSHVIGLILCRTPNLQTFELDIIQPTEFESDSFDFAVLKDSLDQLRTTLTQLTIRFQLYPLDHDIYVGGMQTRTELDAAARGALGSFRKYTALTHLQVSLHTLFGFGNIGGLHKLAAYLPPTLQSLAITDDLWMFADFQEAFEDIDAMAIFRRFLTGEVLASNWPQRRTNYAYERQYLGVTWVPGPDATGGEWKIATPQLKSFVYDLRKRGYLSHEYWNKGMIRKQFRMMCKEQGIQGEVLWEKIRYVMSSMWG